MAVALLDPFEAPDRADVEHYYRKEFRRLISTVNRRIGDVHVAEEAVQEAFAVALERWPRDGTPRNPCAWLVSTARNKAIDAMRRAARFEAIRRRLGYVLESSLAPSPAVLPDARIPDERLQLVFTCCHPALALETQLALVLLTLCGLSTDEIAGAFLVRRPTLAQRLVRAKRKIAAGIPAEVSHPARLAAVMAVISLLFDEGAVLRADLPQEAIRLASLLAEQFPDSSAARALLAQMLLRDVRSRARP
jgi:RNA polymerase sigma-70 factor (ECF subfamily)